MRVCLSSRTCLRNNDIFILEELANPWPEVRLRDDIAMFHGNFQLRFRHNKFASLMLVFLETGGEFWKQMFHPNPWEVRMAHVCVVRMQLKLIQCR